MMLKAQRLWLVVIAPGLLSTLAWVSRRWPWTLWLVIVAPGLLSACDGETGMEQEEIIPPETVAAVDKSDPNWKQQLGKPELMDFKPGEKYYWDMETNMGNMSFLLFHDQTPMHVSSTIYLTELGFYDNVLFHRVIPGFMAQGGDPTGTGRGGPGYRYDGEFPKGFSHDRPGLLSMANAGPGTDGSQFFITFIPAQHLDGLHTIFGELVDGMETLKALEERGNNTGQPIEKLEIIKATIRRESTG